MLSDVLKVVQKVGQVFDQLGILWVIGGSVASSIQGIPRSTQDVDRVAALKSIDSKPFSGLL